MARKVSVQLEGRAYDVHVGAGTLTEVAGVIEEIGGVTSVIVVSDPTVTEHHGATLRTALAAGSCAHLGPAMWLQLPEGEANKTRSNVDRIWLAALEHGIDRQALLIAFGGGVVCDMTGFAASTLLRGLRWMAVPTSLLAQVDASVGGKTGLNVERGKNLIGTFWQPSAVIVDAEMLFSLDARELNAGLAEVAKYGAAFDGTMLDLLETRAEDVRAREPTLMSEIAARCCALKAGVVQQDERDLHARRLLNFGHTIGHALEQATGYQRYLHGEAVAIGMVWATRLSAELGLCPPSNVTRLQRLLAGFSLPVALPSDVASERLLAAIASDKKVVAGELNFVFCHGLGKAVMGVLSFDELALRLSSTSPTQSRC